MGAKKRNGFVSAAGWTMLAVLATATYAGLWVYTLAGGPILTALVLGMLIPVIAVFGAATAAVVHAFRTGRPDRPPFYDPFLKACAGWTVALFAPVGIALAAILVFNATSPVLAPRYVMTNGTKTVVFQGMSHIGSKSFYEKVVADALKLSGEGYTLYFEGVGQGTDTNEKRLYQVMGLKDYDLSELYDLIANVAGLTTQGKAAAKFQELMELDSPKYVNADVSVDDMLAEWDRLIATDPAVAAATSSTPSPEASSTADAEGKQALTDAVKGLDPSQRWFYGAVFQTLLRVTWANQAKADEMVGNVVGGQPQTAVKLFTDRVIIDFRNERLAQRILSASDSNIYVNYGMGHFEGLLEDLKKADPKWHVTETSSLRAMN